MFRRPKLTLSCSAEGKEEMFMDVETYMKNCAGKKIWSRINDQNT
jgi:hypothetical protein